MKQCSIHKPQQEFIICLPLGWEQQNVSAKNANCETKIQFRILVQNLLVAQKVYNFLSSELYYVPL